MFLISNTAKGPDLQKSAEPPRIVNILLNSLGKPGQPLLKGENLKISITFELCTLLVEVFCLFVHEIMTGCKEGRWCGAFFVHSCL